MEQPIDLENYGNLPRHIRQNLATVPTQPSTSEAPNHEENPPISEMQSPQDVIEQTQQDEEPAHQAIAEEPATTPEDNEAKTWKGRLSKEQAEHKETQNRYLAEVQARQKAEQEAKEAREKLAQLEQQPQPPSSPAHLPEQESEETLFSEEELVEMEFSMGAVGEKLAKFLRSQKAQKTTSQIDVEKAIDERFTQERQRNEEQAKTAAFGKAISEHAPTLQGLLNDSAFIEFVNHKTIDFAGNTAGAFLNFVGANRRADLVPKVAEIIREFEQSRQPSQQPVTAPPSNKGGSVNVRNTGKKPKPTPAIVSQMQRLMRSGETEKLRELQDKYDLD